MMQWYLYRGDSTIDSYDSVLQDMEEILDDSNVLLFQGKGCKCSRYSDRRGRITNDILSESGGKVRERWTHQYRLEGGTGWCRCR